MNLYKHQQDFVDNGFDKGYLVWGTGTGKTITSLHWAHKRSRGLTLIVCPKALVTNWQRNTAIVGINSLVITKEQFKTPVMQMKLKGIGIDCVIIDECHYFTGTKSKMFKAMVQFLKDQNVSYFLGLTATPYLSTPWNIYALGILVGRRDYPWSWIYFKKSYFVDIKLQPKNPYSRVISKVKPGIEGQMADKVREISSIVRMEDCVDVPEENFDTEYFSLTKAQRKAILDLQEPVSIVYWTKTHQICGGSMKGDEFTPVSVYDSLKFDRTIELCGQTRKLIVVCRYNHEIRRLEQELRLKGIPVSVINGAVADKQAVLDAANADKRHVLLVNAACSEGWNAQSFPVMVFYSYDFSLKSYIQMRGRIQRIDGIQKATYISLVTKDTVDQDVFESVTVKKTDFHLNIYEKDSTGGTDDKGV